MGSSSKAADEQLEAELRGFNSDTPVATVKRTLSKFVLSSEKPRVSSQTLAALLEIVLIDWLPCFTEQERSDYFDVFFLDDGLSSTETVLSTVISSLEGELESSLTVSSLQVITNLIHARLFERDGLQQLLIALSARNPEDDAHHQIELNRQLTLISSLPDRLGRHFNRLKLTLPDSLAPRNYAVAVMTQTMEFVVRFNGGNINGAAVAAAMLSKLARLGFSDVISACLMPHILNQTLIDKMRELLLRIPDSSIENVLYRILQQLNAHVKLEGNTKIENAVQLSPVTSVLSSLLDKSKHAVFLMSNKFLLQRLLPPNTSRFVVHLLLFNGVNQSEPIVFISALKTLAEVWSSEGFVNHSTIQQHKYSTRMLCLFIERSSKKLLETHGVVVSLIHGIHKHLESPVAERRRLGMIVGERMSTIIDSANPLVFEYEKDPDEDFGPVEEDSTLPQQDTKTKPNNDGTRDSSTSQKRRRRDKRRRITKKRIDDEEEFSSGDDDPDALYFERDHSHKRAAFKSLLDGEVFSNEEQGDNASKLEEEEEEEGDEGNEEAAVDNEEDDDGLTPYDLNEEEDEIELKVPLYLRDCLPALRSDDPDRIEAAMKATDSLVRANVSDLDDMSVGLASALTHLTDEYAITGFQEMRMKTLVSLTVMSIANVVSYLTREFYSANQSISSRIDILDVLINAARELSSLEHQSFLDQLEEASREEQQQHQNRYGVLSIVKADNPKTRRWASAPKPKPKAKRNRFLDVAGSFFYPLLKHYDNKENRYNLLAQDGLVLGKLIYALAVFIECTGPLPPLSTVNMCNALLQMTWNFRYHKQAFVRRSVIYAITQCLMVLPKFILLEQFEDDLIESKEWMQDVANEDSDEMCRNLALSFLVEMGKKLENTS